MDNNNKNWIFIVFFIIFVSLCQLPASTNSYDAAGSCDPRSSRRGRAQLLRSIPCDLSVNGYCNLPGSSYPWHAVRKFVHENQGMMKRMYGDVRHISVLKAEFDNNNNNIEIDDIAKTAERYSRSGQRSLKYLNNNMRNEYKLNDVLSEPHFRPAIRQHQSTVQNPDGEEESSDGSTTPSTSTATVTTTATTSGMPPTTAPTTTSSAAPSSTSTESVIEKINGNDDDFNTMTNDLRQLGEQLEDLLKANIETNSVYVNISDNTFSRNVVPELVEPPIQVISAPNSTEAPVKPDNATISSTLKLVQSEMFPEDTTLPPATESNNSVLTEQVDTTPVVEIVADEAGEVSEEYSDENLDDVEASVEALPVGSEMNQSKQNNRVDNIPAVPPPSSTKFKIRVPDKTKTMEGGLFQDEEKKELTFTNMRGINACPVKEEVVAPFWANNTRGEVLALLNLYPFEQYVHWEKCTNEHRQMYCRDGCRCEQQFRLHRLLAYDPHNECRGIFSDWFRFPSCCICKCYDVPFDLRVTSRSPRSTDDQQQPQHRSNTKHPLEFVEEEVQRAIYDHAAGDWYRPSELTDDDDFF